MGSYRLEPGIKSDVPRYFDRKTQPCASFGIPSDERSKSGADSRPMSEDSPSAKGLENALQALWQKGAIAWRDVPSASAWVEELRGNSRPEPECDKPFGRVFDRPESDSSRFKG